MKGTRLVGMLGSSLLFLCACTTPMTPQEVEVIPPEDITSPTGVPLEESIPKQEPKVSAPFFLSEPGSYYAGNRIVTLTDESRDGRKIELLVWYPAEMQKDQDGGNPIIRDAPADMSGAPYPLIFTEPDSADSMFLSHLATHGFVMVVVKPLSPSQVPNFTWIEDTRDFLFSLDQLASKPPDGLDNLMDTDHVGVTGFSYGGDLSLALSGARLDPGFYQSQCAQMTDIVPIKHQWVYEDWTCQEFGQWDAFVSYAGEEITN